LFNKKEFLTNTKLIQTKRNDYLVKLLSLVCMTTFESKTTDHL